MTAPHADQIIDGYLSRLNGEAADLPKARREELLRDVREHIAEARANLSNEADADILNILDRLGEPVDLVQEARDRFGFQQPQPFKPGLVEIGALVLLPIFWIAGVALLWSSNAWNLRDKLIGTFLPPGGLASAPFVLFIAFSGVAVHSGSCGSAPDAAGNLIQSSCTTSGPSGLVETIAAALFATLMVLVLILPVLTVIYLAIRLRGAGLRMRRVQQPG